MSVIKGRLLAMGSAVRIAEFLASAVIAFVLTPFLIHRLGENNYGLWVLIFSFLGYYGIMDLGLGSAVQRYVSRAAGANEKDEINTVVNTSIVIFTVIGALLVVFSFCAAFFLPFIIKNITEVNVFRFSIIIIGFTMAFLFPLSVFLGILNAHLRYDLTSSVGLAILVIKTSLIVFLLNRGFGVIALVAITAGTELCRFILFYIFTKRLYKEITVAMRLFNPKAVKKLFNYSKYTFITRAADQLRFNVGNLIIAIFLGFASVTLFSIASKLIRNFLLFMSSALEVTMPVFSLYEGRSDYESIREKYFFFMKISAYLSLLIGGLLIIFGRQLIIFWVGKDYAAAYTLLLILLVPFVFDVMQIPGNTALYGISKHGYYALTNSIEGVCNLLLTLILVKPYGIYGVALGTAIPMLIMKIAVQPVYICKLLGIGFRKFYLQLMLPVVFFSSAFMFLFWLTTKNLVLRGLANLLILLMCGAAIFVTLAYTLGFREDEKNIFKKALSIGKAK